MVVSMLIAEAIVPTPVAPTPTIQKSAPTPGVWIASDNGEYMVQPKSAAPPGVRNSGQHCNATDGGDPKTKGVQTWECHVRCADLKAAERS